MRPNDLTPVAALAAKHSHGSKMSYMAGCRCQKCKAGNSAYECRLLADRFWFGPNTLVSTDEVKRHLKWLATHGIGHKTVAKACGVGKSTLADILWYGKTQIRRRRALRILSLQPSLDVQPKTHKVDAAETAARLRALGKMGIPFLVVSRDALGNSNALQIAAVTGEKDAVIVRTAIAIRDYHARVLEAQNLWLRRIGNIPPRHYVYWKPRRSGMTIRSLELRRFASTYEWNHLYPEPLKDVMRLNNQIKRAYRAEGRKRRGKKQDAGFTQPSLRDIGSIERRREADGYRARQGGM